ncbi:hypothetical protein [Thalassomonas haliotis]|nr:hypothetical protein [Thalassomonas haliotis]
MMNILMINLAGLFVILLIVWWFWLPSWHFSSAKGKTKKQRGN